MALMEDLNDATKLRLLWRQCFVFFVSIEVLFIPFSHILLICQRPACYLCCFSIGAGDMIQVYTSHKFSYCVLSRPSGNVAWLVGLGGYISLYTLSTGSLHGDMDG